MFTFSVSINDARNDQFCNYLLWRFLLIFVLLKLTCLVTLFDCMQASVFQNKECQKLTIFGIFNESVNVARFARNVE